MFKKLESGSMYISDRNLTPNENGVLGLDIDVSGIESYLTVWMADKKPSASEQQMAEFICFCFNLQQKYDIGLFEETISSLQEVLDYWDSGNFTRKQDMWDRTRIILTTVKQTKK